MIWTLRSVEDLVVVMPLKYSTVTSPAYKTNKVVYSVVLLFHLSLLPLLAVPCTLSSPQMAPSLVMDSPQLSHPSMVQPTSCHAIVSFPVPCISNAIDTFLVRNVFQEKIINESIPYLMSVLEFCHLTMGSIIGSLNSVIHG